MASFAENTTVPVEKSRAEIEKLITRYGARSTAFVSQPGRALIVFEAQERRVMFELPLPDVNAPSYVKDGRGSERSAAKIHDAWEKDCRRLWRALALVIKAKLEAVETGITTFEKEFLAHIVLPSGATVGDEIAPRIAQAYQRGEMVPLLPAPGKRS